MDPIYDKETTAELLRAIARNALDQRDKALADLKAAQKRIAMLKENHIMQLTAIDVISRSDTPESLNREMLDRSHAYWTPVLENVAIAMQQLIDVRNRIAVEDALGEKGWRVEWIPDGWGTDGAWCFYQPKRDTKETIRMVHRDRDTAAEMAAEMAARLEARRSEDER